MTKKSGNSNLRLLGMGYAITIFASAFLLFQVQPLMTKAILPWFGGTPSIWTTCMLVFQSLLFAGYAYAHFVTVRFRPRVQVPIHAVLIVGALATLPILPSLNWKPTSNENPALQVILIIFASVGLPFFILSTTGPLLQRWFSYTHPDKSPYRLYALSNAGSLLALISYPFMVEPALSIERQSVMWSWSFGLFAMLCVVCGIAVLRSANVVLENPLPLKTEGVGSTDSGADMSMDAKPRFTRIALWFLLSWVPSIMLLATTNQVCLDVASVPFLWVLPLSLYLVSFILCFHHHRWYWRTGYALAVAITSVGMTVALVSGGALPIHFQIVVFTAGLFVSAMFCHGELVHLKPHPRYLTLFYLVLSAGGAAGGIFVSIAAPLLFNSYLELHFGIFATCALVLFLFYRQGDGLVRVGRPVGKRTAIVFTAVLVVLTTGGLAFDVIRERSGVLHATRNFYGILRVREDATENASFHRIVLLHGHIIHGSQFSRSERLPTTYFGNKSGVGLALRHHHAERPRRIGVLGLGIGTIAVYAKSGDVIRFYEIDKDVIRIARQYFTFLRNCDGSVDIALGDGRMTMERELEHNESQQYDVLAIDAFSGDSIPTHLMTLESFEVYLGHLKQEGILAVNITNKHLGLEPVVSALAKRLQLDSRVVYDSGGARTPPSAWVLLSRDSKVFKKPVFSGLPTLDHERTVLWTDVHCNLYSVVRKFDFGSISRALDDYPAFVNRGTVALDANDLVTAETEFRQAIERRPDDPPVWVSLGVTMARKGKTAEAIKCFERAIELNPKYSEAYNNLGIAVISTNRLRGVECFQLALRLDPRNTDALCNFGNVLAQEGYYSQAIQHYELALAIDPDMEHARRSMAAVRQMELKGSSP